jgi:hypothetical protein
MRESAGRPCTPPAQALSDVAFDRRNADNFAGGVTHRRFAQGNVDLGTVLAYSSGFILMDGFVRLMCLI